MNERGWGDASRNVQRARAVALILLFFFSMGGGVRAQDEFGDEDILSLTTGFDFSSGDYGTDSNTEIWYVPASLKYEALPWTAKITVPYLRITGAGNVIGGGEGGIVVGDDEEAKKTTEEGLGDIITSLGYGIEPSSSWSPYIDFIVKVKFPTADEDRGLGTGEFDYSAQFDLAKNIGNFTPLATVGYKIKGDAPGVELDNVIFASVGTAYQFTEQHDGGLTLDYQEAAADTADDALELFGYLGWRMRRSLLLTGYGVVGFTDGSPDEEAGLQIKYDLPVR